MGIFQSIAKIIFGSSKDEPFSYTSQSSKRFEVNSGNPQKAWIENEDIIIGLKFHATLQLRTPLRVLTRHGEVYSDKNKEPPKIAKELWEGIWIPQLKTFRELGLDVDELSESTTATSIGQINSSDYLLFLISIREILELEESIDDRIFKLRHMQLTANGKTFVNSHGGIDQIINEVFPPFIHTIPKLKITTINELSKLNINTANQIQIASDDTLLNLSGIGKATLKNVRDYCAGMIINRDEMRLDKVVR